MHLPALIGDLALILGVAALVTLLFQRIKQPVVLGYIVAGIIVGPYTPTGLTVSDVPNIKIWAELGVIFLMFSLGLEFTFPKLARVGVTATGTAIIEVILMVAIGYIAGKALGWTDTDSIFLGGILSISSTTIIIRSFDELGLKTKRFAELVFGVLIVEDLAAILLLVALSTMAVTQSFFSAELAVAGFKLVLVVGSWFLIGYFVVPSFFRAVQRWLGNETLTVLSLGLCLMLAVVAARFEYSPALGAFIMGSILAGTRESVRIEHLVQPTRDIFAAVFFVSVGMLVDPKVMSTNWLPIVLITVITIVGKVLTTTLGALITGQKLGTAVQMGFSLAQIGEFSFIIATLGDTLNVTSDFLYPVAVSVSVVTTFTTPYLIQSSDKVARFLESRLPLSLSRRLATYATWAQKPRNESATRTQTLLQAARFFLCGTVVTVIFLLVQRRGLDYLTLWIVSPRVVLFAAWLVSVVIAAPFVWGMFSAFRSPSAEKGSHLSSPSNFGPAQFLGQILTLLLVGLLSSVFFSTWTALLLTALAGIILFVVLYRRLERSYRWFERRFISNVRATPQEDNLAALAPWDVHTVRSRVHQNSVLVGRKIHEEQIRKRFGLNIVVIQRGSKVLASPGPNEFLFPGDELLLLGTDTQIDAFRAICETASGDAGDGSALSEYSLRHLLVTEDSPFLGLSLVEAKLRENLDGLVVGLERGNIRTINPDPEWALLVGDLLWVVTGPKK